MAAVTRADFDIASYTRDTILSFGEPETYVSPLPSNYNDIANQSVLIAVLSRGILLADTAMLTLNAIGFTSFE